MALKTRTYGINTAGLTNDMLGVVLDWIESTFGVGTKVTRTPDGLLIWEYSCYTEAHRQYARQVSMLNMGIAIGQGRYGQTKM